MPRLCEPWLGGSDWVPRLCEPCQIKLRRKRHGRHVYNQPFFHGSVSRAIHMDAMMFMKASNKQQPDTGDIYSGMDRFGRIKDLRWRNTSSNTDLSRVEYGYDRASNRIWRENPTDTGRQHDWLYGYDGLHQLKDGERGTLNSIQAGANLAGGFRNTMDSESDQSNLRRYLCSC